MSYVPNTKFLSVTIPKILSGSQNFKIGHMTQAAPPLMGKFSSVDTVPKILMGLATLCPCRLTFQPKIIRLRHSVYCWGLLL